MPAYEWKNEKTGERVEVHRERMAEYNIPPDESGDWVRVIVPVAVPFETLRDKGVFEHLPQTSLRKLNK